MQLQWHLSQLGRITLSSNRPLFTLAFDQVSQENTEAATVPGLTIRILSACASVRCSGTGTYRNDCNARRLCYRPTLVERNSCGKHSGNQNSQQRYPTMRRGGPILSFLRGTFKPILMQ